MKKLLLLTLFGVFVLNGAFAQFRWQSDVNIGQILQAVNPANKDTFTVNFNTAKANSFWLKSKKVPANDSIVLYKCSTQRGIQCLVYSDSTTTTQMQSGSFKGGAYTGNGNPVHVANMDSLLNLMTKSALGTTGTTVNGSTADSLTAPAQCLFDVNGDNTNQAFGEYPGKYKHVEYGFEIDYTGKGCPDDITFTINTYDAGTTGKTASYQLAVYAGSVADANLIGSKIDGFYVTGSGPKSVSLANVLSVLPSAFANKKIFIYLRTWGTTNANGVADGKPNPSVNHIPTVYDPTIVFDNFNMTYTTATWQVPAGAIANAYINYNNGAPAVKATDLSLTNPGTPVPVVTNQQSTIRFNLQGSTRFGALTLQEDLSHSSFFVPDTANIMQNDGNGNYTVKVNVASLVYNSTSLLWTLTIPAPATGSVNDDIMVPILVDRTSDGSSAIRIEINNGVRFFYDFYVTSTTATGLNSAQSNAFYVTTSNSYIYANMATQNVDVFTIAGQKIAEVSAAEARKGIKVDSGIYIVKSGSNVQKVLVQ